MTSWPQEREIDPHPDEPHYEAVPGIDVIDGELVPRDVSLIWPSLR